MDRTTCYKDSWSAERARANRRVARLATQKDGGGRKVRCRSVSAISSIMGSERLNLIAGNLLPSIGHHPCHAVLKAHI